MDQSGNALNEGSMKAILYSTHRTMEKVNTYKVTTYPGFRSGLTRDSLRNENNERIVKSEKYGNFGLPSQVLLDTHAVIGRLLWYMHLGRQKIPIISIENGNRFGALEVYLLV